jgi:Phosphotransferase enzyme family
MAPAVTDLAPDPAVPHRDALLDEDTVADVIARRLVTGGMELTRCERIRATYRFGDGLRVLHCVEVGGRPFPVGARTFPPERLERVHLAAMAEAVPTDPLRPVAAARELGALLWTFPNDRKLAPVRDLPDVVGELLGARLASTALVAYAPEKAATVACLGADGETLAYAKTHAPDAGLAGAAIQAALAEQAARQAGPLRLPSVFGHSGAARTVVLEPLEGAPVADPAGFRAFGAGIAALHRLEQPTELRAFERFLPERIERAARLLDQARPDVGGAAHTLAAALLARLPADGSEPRVLHGDVHPKNALLGNGGIALIDLDQAAAGPPAADLGSALAGLEYRRLAEGADAANAAALLAGYATVRRLPDAGSIAWHTAAALLAERAVRSVTRVRADGLAQLGGLLERGRALLEDAK